MTICQALLWAREKLNKNIKPNEGEQTFAHLQGFEIDVEVLLSHVLKKSKEFILAHPGYELSKPQLSKFQTLIRRRAKGVPVAYLVNHKEFYGMDFYVDERVLVPRPESELLVNEVISVLGGQKHENRELKIENGINIVDVGTGSGCVGIAVAKNLTQMKASRCDRLAFKMDVYATDISRDALTVARKNARRHGKKIKFLQGNLLEPLIERNIEPDIIVANLPYLKPSQIKGDIKYEPRQALVGGKDGLKYYEKLLKQITGIQSGSTASLRSDYGASILKQFILFEIDPSQSKSIKNLIKKYLPKAKIKIKKDLADLERLVIIAL